MLFHVTNKEGKFHVTRLTSENESLYSADKYSSILIFHSQKIIKKAHKKVWSRSS